MLEGVSDVLGGRCGQHSIRTASCHGSVGKCSSEDIGDNQGRVCALQWSGTGLCKQPGCSPSLLQT